MSVSHYDNHDESYGPPKTSLDHKRIILRSFFASLFYYGEFWTKESKNCLGYMITTRAKCTKQQALELTQHLVQYK
jgi:hypothetical protein